MSEPKQAIEDRIYIGNVDFKANEEDLKQFFDGLKISDINIPSTTKKYGKKIVEKHLGFAFVQFEEKSDADKAVEEFNGKEFKNRKIYVKKALPEATEEEKQKKNELFKQRKAEQAAKKVKPPKKAQDESAAPAPKSETDDVPKATTEAKSNDAKIPEGEPSEDVIFITNLAYKVTTKTLVGLFKEYKPKWIHVPTRRVPYHAYARAKASGTPSFNKGIAFVKFSDHETQLKAIEEFNGKEVFGREIIVDVAINARVPKDPKEPKEPKGPKDSEETEPKEPKLAEEEAKESESTESKET